MLQGNSEVFQPEDLDILDQAFEQTWAMVAEEHPSRDHSKDENLKTSIRQKLLTIASAGIVDIELMRKMTLAALRTWPSDNDRAEACRQHESLQPR